MWSRRALALAALALAAGCGFQLRGTADVPFETLYVPPTVGTLGFELKRAIQTGTRAKLVENPKDAQAVLQFTEESRAKEILSLTGTGRVREFTLRYKVSFRVHDGKGGDFVAPSSIQLQRDLTYSDTDILAKEAEEQLLYRDMQNDMVQQILRRLATARRAAPSVQ